jgi:hypothetical protein
MNAASATAAVAGVSEKKFGAKPSAPPAPMLRQAPAVVGEFAGRPARQVFELVG